MFTSVWLARSGKILAVAAAYFLLAWAVFSAGMTAIAGALIWPSAGLALAALVRFGNQVWPGVFLGSFAFSGWLAWQNDQVASMVGLAGMTAAGHAIGATLQALLGALLMRRFVVLPSDFDREADVAKFLLIAGPLACLVDASWSVTLEWFTGAVRPNDYLSSWFAFWMRDLLGSLMIAPVLLIDLSEKPTVDWRRALSVGVPWSF